MLLFNKTTGFFILQYLCKETTIIVFSFFYLHRDSVQGNVACKSTTVGWVWPGVLSHAQICQNLSGVTLIGLAAV